MGSPQQGTPVDKPPNSKAAAPSAAAAATVPAATAPPAIAMVPYPDWGGYIAPAWAGQAMIPAYGVPYAPMFYAHPGMAMVAPCQNPESEGKKRPRGKSADGKVSSDSAREDASDSGGTGSEGSSATGNESAEPQVRQDFTAGGKRIMSIAPLEGDVAQAVVLYNSPTPESSRGGRVPKLPVSAPGRTTLPGPATNLNMGLEVSDALYAGTGGAKVFLDVANSAPGMPRCERPLPDHQWMQMSERELRREKRKQSNRESARRSRLRKQQECEELAKRVNELTRENNALRVEAEQLKKDLEELGDKNASLMASLKEKSPSLLTEEEHVRVSQASLKEKSPSLTSLKEKSPSLLTEEEHVRVSQASLKEKSPSLLTKEEHVRLHKCEEISALEVGRFAPNSVETDDK